MEKRSLKLIPLGGLGEIGKNMMVIEYGSDIIVVDAGIMFPRDDMPGVDLIIPDISYLIEHRRKVRAILITHGHEDHTGALPYILKDLDVPVYASRLAHGLISAKLKQHRMLNQVQLHSIEPGKNLKFGCFQVEFFRVCHSIPDAMGIALRTPVGLVVHTGDFKIDHTPVDQTRTDLGALARFGQSGVLLLLSDSTYADMPGYTPSEQTVGLALDQSIANAPGRVIVATFASLISRIQQVIDAAVRHDRKVTIIGRSMVNNVKMALSMGYIKAKDDVLVDIDAMRNLPANKIVIITTGSQGEPTSGLVRIANRVHKDIQVAPGDTIIVSATPIPGNETLVSKTIDDLYRQGAYVLYQRISLVHVHGHASQEELKTVINLTKPQFFVPIHGEYRLLTSHANIARSLGVKESNTLVIEDGDVLDITPKEARVSSRVPAGHVYIHGHKARKIHDTLLQDRKSLAQDGVIAVFLTLDKESWHLMCPPKVVSDGLVNRSDVVALHHKSAEMLYESLNLAPHYPADWNEAQSTVKSVLGNFLYKEIRQRPVIIPMAIEV